MYFKLLLGKLNLELSFLDRSLGFYLFYSNKTIINYERYIPRYFKCAICGRKTEYKGDKLKLCEKHYEEYMENIQQMIGLP